MTAATALTAAQTATLHRLLERWPSLRILTVRQPWSDLIMAGVKDVENRSWPVPSTLPQWQRCNRCGRRSRDGVPETIPVHPKTGERGTAVHWHDACHPTGVQGELRDDGPFPFRLGIHAAAKPAENAGPETWPVYPVDWRTSGYELPEVYALSVLLGTVEVTGCHHADECRRDRPIEGCSSVADLTCSRWAEPGDVWHWTLTDPRPLDVPIPMRGMLGLWRLEFVEMAP